MKRRVLPAPCKSTIPMWKIKRAIRRVKSSAQTEVDIEQLKLILDAAQAAGEGAYSIVIVWFLLQFLKTLLLWGVIGGALTGGYKLAKRGIDADDWKSRLEAVTGCDLYYQSDRRRFWNWLKERVAENPIAK